MSFPIVMLVYSEFSHSFPIYSEFSHSFPMFSHRVQERHGLPTQTSSSPPNEFLTVPKPRFSQTAPRMLLHPGDSPTCPKRQRFECGFNTHRIHGAGFSMLTWLGYIDGIHGAPCIAAPWIRHGITFNSTQLSSKNSWFGIELMVLKRRIFMDWLKGES